MMEKGAILYIGQQKHTNAMGKRDRESTFWPLVFFCHAGTVCRSARAQRPELKLRNPDRLSSSSSSLPPPYTVYHFTFSLSSISLSVCLLSTFTLILCHRQCLYTSVLFRLFFFFSFLPRLRLQPPRSISICRQTFVLRCSGPFYS